MTFLPQQFAMDASPSTTHYWQHEPPDLARHTAFPGLPWLLFPTLLYLHTRPHSSGQILTLTYQPWNSRLSFLPSYFCTCIYSAWKALLATAFWLFQRTQSSSACTKSWPKMTAFAPEILPYSTAISAVMKSPLHQANGDIDTTERHRDPGSALKRGRGLAELPSFLNWSGSCLPFLLRSNWAARPWVLGASLKALLQPTESWPGYQGCRITFSWGEVSPTHTLELPQGEWGGQSIPPELCERILKAEINC